MYGVFGRKAAIISSVGILAALAISAGLISQVAEASTAPRELPIYSVETTEKMVSLGINCAWDDSDLDHMLDVLDSRGVKATFFMVGDWCEKYPEAAKRIADAGHEVGSHSASHPDMTKLNREEIENQLSDSKEIIERTTQKPCNLFRAPSGAYNNLVVSTARACGWEVIQWNNDSVDWKTPPVEEMVEKVCGRAAPGDIMLFHLGKQNTVSALEQVIERLQAQGYQFVPVGDLIYTGAYTIDHTGRQFQRTKDA